MPALNLFGRRWLLASDDLPGPATFLATFHFIWVGLLIGWLAALQGPEECHGVTPYYIAVGGLLAAFFISFILEVAAAVISYRGSIFETQKRAALPTIIYVNALCYLTQVAFNSYASYLIVVDPPECSSSAGKVWDPVDVMDGVVYSTWAILIGLIVFVFSAYNLFPDFKNPQEWERQCECLAMFSCPCASRRKKKDSMSSSSSMQGAATKRLGSLFALMFGHIDLTPSDVLTAFGLALNRQRMRRIALEKKLSARATRPGLTLGGAAEVNEAAAAAVAAAAERTRDQSPASGDGLLSCFDGISSVYTDGVDAMEAGSSGRGVDARAEERENQLVLGPVGAAELTDAAYFMKYSFAAYGWMLFVWEKKTTGIAQLCCGRSCGMWSSIATVRHGLPLSSSQAPYFNREAILQASELSEQDLLEVRLEGDAQNVLPYYIAVDHTKQAIILAIRGSLSLDDVVRDLLFEPADLDTWLNRSTPWDAPLPPLQPATRTTVNAAHSGIFEATRATLEDLQARGKLAELLLGPAPLFPGYQLVVCGHSLGAGCSFLLSLRLRQFFPHLRCWCFSPPGGLATAELCKSATDWCTSVVCGKEMIPRLTLATFEHARDEMVHCAARCKKPKTSLLLGWLFGRVYQEAELFYTPESLPPEPMAWLRSYEESLAQTAAQRAYVETASKFGPPGRVIYLKHTGKKSVKRGKILGLQKTVVREYRAVWVDGRVLIEEGVLLSGRMMLDHFPDYSLAVLRRLASAGGGGASAGVSEAAGEADLRQRVHQPSSPSSSSSSSSPPK